MLINITFRYCAAFIAFVFLFGQLHEMAHLTAAYMVYGRPGKQIDFNLWTLCTGCEANPYSYVPTIFGPVFSYLCMWTGYFMLRSENRKIWNLAFVLVLGNLAFARIFTAAMGGGDEITVLKELMSDQPLWLIKTLGFLLVFAAAFPPLYLTHKRLDNKKRILLMVGFCLLPLLIMYPYEFILLGKLLKAGFFAKQHFLGIADFIGLHTLLMGAIVVIFRKSLFYAYAKS